jgi:hypothetical protein
MQGSVVSRTFKAYVLYQTKLTVKGYAFFETRGPKLPTVNSLLTAWELVPYSWVVDWFFSIGDILRSFSYRPDLIFRTAGVTVTADTVAQYQRCDGYGQFRHRPSGYYTPCTPDGQLGAFAPGQVQTEPSYLLKYKTINRVPFTPADLSWTPKLDVNLNPQRILDALSLASKSLKGHRRLII